MVDYSGVVHERILYVDFTVDGASTDVTSIDAVTFYRTHHDYLASSNGYTPAFKIWDVSSGLPSAATGVAGTDISNAAAGIVFGELIPPPSVIILDVDVEN